MSESVVQPDWIPQDSLRKLHPVRIEAAAEIASILDRAREERVPLHRGTNRQALSERAWIERIDGDRMLLSLADFDPARREQVFLNLTLDGVRYFFATTRIAQEKEHLELAVPAVIYRAERRDRPRREPASREGGWVSVELGNGLQVRGRPIDFSADGLGLELEQPVSASAGQAVTIAFDAPALGKHEHAEIRHLREPAGPGRWRRLGLALIHAPRSRALTIERRPQIAPDLRLAADADLEGGGARSARRIAFRNGNGEEIRAIVDSVGPVAGGIAVIVPPAWGRTKETTLALAETILQTFHRAGESVQVVRFDGIRKRGESHNDSDCLPPIGENLHYTFSQGVRDIEDTIAFLSRSPASAPRKILVASFSIASVETRHAIAEDGARRIDGWLSLVGAVDPQSMIRVISGGVDYFAGAVEGIHFGTQYVQGLLLDIDAATRDAIDSRLAFLDDARRDMAAISIPVTWIAGTEDAWTPVERVLEMLSVGDVSQRKLIEVPTGHQLRSSQEALETFELAAVELARMALGRTVASVQPSRAWIATRRREELRRLKQAKVDLRDFWRDYLVGRDGTLGIELVSATSAYRSLMELQIEGLAPRPGAVVVDVGSGAGALPVQLTEQRDVPPLRIIEVDLVVEGLRRTRLRAQQVGVARHSLSFVVANLDAGAGGAGLPLAPASADAVLASLLLNYLSHPETLLAEIARVLRPGGRLVVSGMRPDADVSKICVAGVDELRSGKARSVWSADGIANFDRPLQEFISSGARLLDLEEVELFRFWDAEELRQLIEGPAFRILSVQGGYGDPPQSWVAVAERTAERAD